MFSKPRKPLLEQFDEKVKSYLTALAYVQNSLKLTEHEKSVFFSVFGDVCTDVSTSIEQLKRSGINPFNRGEAEEYLDSSLPVIIAEMDRELKKAARTVKYDPDAAMPVEAALESLTKSVPGKPSVTGDKIDALFSYRTLFDVNAGPSGTGPAASVRPAEPEKPAERDSGKLDRAMDDIRLKAFLGTLRGNSNRNPEYFFKANSYVSRLMAGGVIPFADASTPVEGPCFTASAPDSISVRFGNGEVVMEYTVAMRTEGESFTVVIGGYVNRNGARVDFSVNEKYPVKIRDTVVNSFGLGRLIEKHGESVRENRNARRGNTADETNAKKNIDEFFSS